MSALPPRLCYCSDGKEGLYRSLPSGHNQRKTGYSWSEVSARADIAERTKCCNLHQGYGIKHISEWINSTFHPKSKKKQALCPVTVQHTVKACFLPLMRMPLRHKTYNQTAVGSTSKIMYPACPGIKKTAQDLPWKTPDPIKQSSRTNQFQLTPKNTPSGRPAMLDRPEPF